MKDCLFCKIVNKEIPSNFLYENENVVAFLDIKQNNPAHTLIVRKKHSRNIFDIKESTLRELIVGVKKMAKAVKGGVEADGINIAMNNEPAAGQLVFHAHIHIIPRFKNDGHEHWHGTPYKNDAEIKTVAENIVSKLNPRFL